MSVIDQFKPKRPPQRREPQVDGPPPREPPAEMMNELARNIRGGVPAPQNPEDFAQPSHRIEHLEAGAMRIIAKFAEVPIKDIDGLIERARTDLEVLVDRALNFRQNIVNHQAQLTADFERYLSGIKLSQEMFEKLGEQSLTLDGVQGDVKAALGEMRREVVRRESDDKPNE